MSSRSNGKFRWRPMPGCISVLYVDGTFTDMVKSPRVAHHIVVSTGHVYDRLFDAQVAAEKRLEAIK